MRERRQFVRVPSWLDGWYTLAGSGPPQATLVRNVGGGGCALFTASLLPAGAMLGMTIEIQGRRVTCTARVMWSGKLLLARRDEHPWAFEAGARFVKITPEDLALLLQAAADGPPP